MGGLRVDMTVSVVIRTQRDITFVPPFYDTIRYDTVDLRTLKSWRDGQLNLAHGPETKIMKKIKIKNRVAQKKRSKQRSLEDFREEEVKLIWGLGFVKEVGFTPEVKERELWMYRVVNQKRRKWWVKEWVSKWKNWYQNKVDEWKRMLIPETRWSITERAISYFLKRMILAQQE